MIDNLKKNTGKSLEEWIAIVKNTGIEKHGEIIKYLKSDHGFTHGFANLVSLKSRGTDAGSAESPESLVDAQYNEKEQLYCLYKKIIEHVEKFGDDIEISPKRAYVSLRRKKQFALVKPSTKTRLDIGINIKGQDPIGRLEKSGSFNAMCSHRVKTEQISDIDEELAGWLKMAYEAAG